METKTRRLIRDGAPAEPPAGSAPPNENSIEPAVDLASASPMPPLPAPAPADALAEPPALTAIADLGSAAFAVLTESQMALARGLVAASAESAALARIGIDIAARTATLLIEARTLSDAIMVGAQLTRAGFDAFAGGSVKFSELGVKLALDSTQPILGRLGLGGAMARPPGG